MSPVTASPPPVRGSSSPGDVLGLGVLLLDVLGSGMPLDLLGFGLPLVDLLGLGQGLVDLFDSAVPLGEVAGDDDSRVRDGTAFLLVPP